MAQPPRDVPAPAPASQGDHDTSSCPTPSPNHEFRKLLTPCAPTYVWVQQAQDTKKPTHPGTGHAEPRKALC